MCKNNHLFKCQTWVISGQLWINLLVHLNAHRQNGEQFSLVLVLNELQRKNSIMWGGDNNIFNNYGKYKTIHYSYKKNYNSHSITWITQPKLTVLTCSGLTFAPSRAALLAIAPRCVAVIPFNFPPKVPKGVRLAPTTNTPVRTSH